MAYDPSLSLAMVASRQLYETMLHAGVERGEEREAALKQALGEFVKLGEMLIALRAPKPVSNVVRLNTRPSVDAGWTALTHALSGLQPEQIA